MSRRRIVLLAIVTAVIVLVAAYLRGSSSVPAGQEALATLSEANFGPFEQAFDKAAKEPRLVLLLSPT
ncbi:MAG TPA: hypothetical protein VKQ28_04280 [Candidatus Acidoferrum sp.]|nr:hypothetical protein [Candidatus Acidoferrum sp.]